MTKIHYGVKPDIFKYAAETAQFISSLAWVKTQGMSDLLRRRARFGRDDGVRC